MKSITSTRKTRMMTQKSSAASKVFSSRVNRRSPAKRSERSNLITQAKYGDESIYFDLDDIENTAGSWDMYGVDANKRYPDIQSDFFERATTGLARREAMLGFLALGGGASILVWGAKGSKDASLP